MNNNNMPMGLGMALAQNMDAMQVYSSLSPQEQQKIIDHTHQIRSKSEMHQFVQSLADGNRSFF